MIIPVQMLPFSFLLHVRDTIRIWGMFKNNPYQRGATPPVQFADLMSAAAGSTGVERPPSSSKYASFPSSSMDRLDSRSRMHTRDTRAWQAGVSGLDTNNGTSSSLLTTSSMSSSALSSSSSSGSRSNSSLGMRSMPPSGSSSGSTGGTGGGSDSRSNSRNDMSKIVSSFEAATAPRRAESFSADDDGEDFDDYDMRDDFSGGTDREDVDYAGVDFNSMSRQEGQKFLKLQEKEADVLTRTEKVVDDNEKMQKEIEKLMKDSIAEKDVKNQTIQDMVRDIQEGMKMLELMSKKSNAKRQVLYQKLDWKPGMRILPQKARTKLAELTSSVMAGASSSASSAASMLTVGNLQAIEEKSPSSAASGALSLKAKLNRTGSSIGSASSTKSVASTYSKQAESGNRAIQLLCSHNKKVFSYGTLASSASTAKKAMGGDGGSASSPETSPRNKKPLHAATAVTGKYAGRNTNTVTSVGNAVGALKKRTGGISSSSSGAAAFSVIGLSSSYSRFVHSDDDGDEPDGNGDLSDDDAKHVVQSDRAYKPGEKSVYDALNDDDYGRLEKDDVDGEDDADDDGGGEGNTGDGNKSSSSYRSPRREEKLSANEVVEMYALQEKNKSGRVGAGAGAGNTRKIDANIALVMAARSANQGKASPASSSSSSSGMRSLSEQDLSLRAKSLAGSDRKSMHTKMNLKGGDTSNTKEAGLLSSYSMHKFIQDDDDDFGTKEDGPSNSPDNKENYDNDVSVRRGVSVSQTSTGSASASSSSSPFSSGTGSALVSAGRFDREEYQRLKRETGIYDSGSDDDGDEDADGGEGGDDDDEDDDMRAFKQKERERKMKEMQRMMALKKKN